MSARPMLETLSAIWKGQLLEELALEQQQLVNSIKATNRGGSITLKINYRPGGKGDVNYLQVDAKLTVKSPELEHESVILFPLADGNLSRQDQTQQGFELRPVTAIDKATDKPAAFDPSTGEVLGATK